MGWLRIAEMMLYGQDEYKRAICLYHSMMNRQLGRRPPPGYLKSATDTCK